MKELPNRKPNRLKNYDYSTDGAYFITICTDERRNVFSSIVGQGLAPAESKLTEFGKIAKEQLLLLENRYPKIRIDKYVIMPNHIHIILIVREKSAGASPCPTVSDVICTYKSLTTRLCKSAGYNHKKIFQNSFYDHIIRDEDDYITKAKYIKDNPGKWIEDKYYTK